MPNRPASDVAQAAARRPRRPRAQAASEQIDLVPNTVPRPRLQSISPFDCPITHDGMSDEFARSVAEWGVIQSVIVIVGDGASAYTVVDGRRRIQAARLANLRTIPALVFPLGTPRSMAAAMSITSNMHRQPNPAVEYDQITVMISAGRSVEEISARLRLPERVIYQRMMLGALHNPWLLRLRSGEIKMSTAMIIASMPATEQRELLVEVGTDVCTYGRARSFRARMREQAILEQATLGGTEEGGESLMVRSGLARPEYAGAADVRSIMPINEESFHLTPAVGMTYDPRAQQADMGNSWLSVMFLVQQARQRMPAPDADVDQVFNELMDLLNDLVEDAAVVTA